MINVARRVVMPYKKMKEIFIEHNQTRPNKPLLGYIVFSKDSFDKHYSEKERTYVVSSNNNAYYLDIHSCSIHGNCLNGKDLGVNLDLYMVEEHGSKKTGWKVERCYMYGSPMPLEFF
jgi:hypothetical protein